MLVNYNRHGLRMNLAFSKSLLFIYTSRFDRDDQWMGLKELVTENCMWGESKRTSQSMRNEAVETRWERRYHERTASPPVGLPICIRVKQ